MYPLSRASLAVTAWGSVLLAAQKDANVHSFELDTKLTKPQVVGYAKLDGALDDELVAPDQVYVSIFKNGVRSVAAVTRKQLAAKTGLGTLADLDKDAVPDLLDDCPATYNPSQLGCPVVAEAVLHATQKLTLANGVRVSGAAGPNALLVSAGSLLTQVGLDGRIGTLLSKGPVELRDRAQASGSITSSGTITFRAGAVALGGYKALVPVATSPLSPINVQYPAPGGAITVPPDQNRDLAPGSYGPATLNGRSYVRLRGGDYYFTSLLIEPTAAFVIDSSTAPVRIYVKSSFIFRGHMIDAAGGEPRALVVYTGTLSAPIESSYRGVLVAPSAKVVLGSKKHFGAFFAKELEVQANAEITHRPSPVAWSP